MRITPLRITVVTAGSRGDVQPYVALARALAARGHDVRLASYPAFAELAAEHGVPFVPFRAEVADEMESDEGRAATLPGVPLLRQAVALRRLARRAEGLLERILDDTWSACQGADALVGSAYGFGVPDVAERLGVPYVWGLIYPLTPTRAFPPFLVPPTWPLPALLNRRAWRLVARCAWLLQRRVTRPFRRRLGLAPGSGRAWRRRAAAAPALYACSEVLLPRPADWPPHATVTGFWTLPAPGGWQPPPELARFLAAGEPPLYVALGRITARDPDALEEDLFAALAATGTRAVVAGGFGYLEERVLPTTVLRVDSAPHDWLLPRCAAAIHHGGPGTAAAALAAGLPALAVPGPLDEPFWAARLAATGAALPPRMAHQLDAGALAAAIRTLRTEGPLRERARELAGSLATEGGAELAARLAEEHFLDSRSRQGGAEP